MRLFVAVEVPAAANDAVDDALGPWRERVHGARWIAAPNRHITLKFLGEVPPARLDEILPALADAAATAAPFTLSLDGLGAFPHAGPDAGRVKVLWVGLGDPGGVLGTLAGVLDRALEPFAAREARPFAPHLTIARFDPPRRLPEGLLGAHIVPSAWTVDRLVLLQSHLGGGPARYEELASMPL